MTNLARLRKERRLPAVITPPIRTRLRLSLKGGRGAPR